MYISTIQKNAKFAFEKKLALLFDSENLEVSPLAKMQKIGCSAEAEL